MRKINITFCLVFQFICILYPNTNSSSNVVVLTNENFLTKINGSCLVFVNFYVPWCNDCSRFAPVFQNLANEIKNNNITVILGEVDCSTQNNTCSSNKIFYYPTLKLFKRGKFLKNYIGRRTVNSTMDFIKENLCLITCSLN